MMLSLAFTALVAITALTPESMEQQATQHVLREFERVGRRAPARDPALTEAARRLAREALGPRNPTGAPDLHSLTLAISDAGSSDLSNFHFVIRAWEHSHAIETFLARKDFSASPATHFGVGVFTAGKRAAVFLLLVDRKVEFQRFPRHLPRPGATRVLCGELLAPLSRADIYVTLPDGTVEPVRLTRETGSEFCAQLRFPQAGSYTVEVFGTSARGPEMAGLFLVDVGGPSERDKVEPVFEPTTPEEARQAILQRINSLRRAHGLQPLSSDPALDAMAQDYSDRMAREGFFGHVAPDGTNLSQRKSAAGLTYRSAGENISMSSGPLAAHFGIEHSPGHRKNLLSARFTHAGIGVAFRKLEGLSQAIVTEIYADTELPASPDPLEEAYKAIDAKRRQFKLPLLKRSEPLERLAMDHARRALKQDAPKHELPDSNAYERAQQAMQDIRTSTVDIYVNKVPTPFQESKNLLDARYTHVGVGVIRGDSPTYGKGQYWVVVIYTAAR
jgi:uncharacterized protein YkwD